MATTSTDADIIRLDKALGSRAHTQGALRVWQELLARHQSVAGTKALEAAEVISKMAGSWAASWSYDPGVRTDKASLGPAPVAAKFSKLGQPGLPEVNFVPYDHGTNRFSIKGPSLLGHPLSFEVVGPTLKSPFCDFQWRVTDNAASPGVGDVLKLDLGVGAKSIPGMDIAPASIEDTFNIYGISSVPRGGLYLVVSQTGGKAQMTDGTATLIDAGLHDGFIGDGDATRTAVDPLHETSKYEVFRVVKVTTDELTLDPGKRLARFFRTAVPEGQTPMIRAITLLRPKVTRLLPVPGSGSAVGEEQVFVIPPPERAAVSDLLPPRDIYASVPSGGNGWTPWNPASDEIGDVNSFDQGALLPVPKPIRDGNAWLNGSYLPFANSQVVRQSVGVGKMHILDEAAKFGASDVGRLLHISDAEFIDGATLYNNGGSLVSVPSESLLGWFEIQAVSRIQLGQNNVDVDNLTLRRVEEVNPINGKVLYGPSLMFACEQALATEGVRLKWTLHESVSSLFTKAHLDPDTLDAVRLTNIIDPSWVERTRKENVASVGGTAARADRAIFDTSSSNGGTSGTNADPGSLLDLGFRMVLYPGWVPDNAVEPNWDNPITSRNVVLDASLSDEQFIEIDYSAGLVRLSHPPKAGSDVKPTSLLSATNNPTGRMVLYAACVPYSMEAGQLGSAMRVTGSLAINADDCLAADKKFGQADVFSNRVVMPLVTNPAQSIGSRRGGEDTQAILLQGDWREVLPATGFVEIVDGDDWDGPRSFEGPLTEGASTFGYSYVSFDQPNVVTRLERYWGGSTVGAAPLVFDHTRPAVAVLRRDVLTPANLQGIAGLDYAYDTVYGSASRSTAIRFEGANLRKEIDGTVTVKINSIRAVAHERLFGEMFSSWLISGGEVTVTGQSEDVDIAAAVYLIDGRRVEVPEHLNFDLGATIQAAGQTNFYLYFDVSTCAYDCEPRLPLPDNEHDVLIWYFQGDGASNVIDHIDMRNPMTDIDRRADAVVGRAFGGAFGWHAPHFQTLREAIRYVNELSDPTGGMPGKHYRILVVGPTRENDSLLPIQPKVPLIIEGTKRNGYDLTLQVAGTAQATSTTTVKLESEDDEATGYYVGWTIRFQNGQAEGLVKTITAYDGVYVTVAAYPSGTAPNPSDSYLLMPPTWMASQSITWGGDNFLFDFDSTKEIVMRDVSFQYEGGGLASPSGIVRGWATFDRINDRLTVEGCVVGGSHNEIADDQGILSLSASLQVFLEVPPGASLLNSLFTNNKISGLTEAVCLLAETTSIGVMEGTVWDGNILHAVPGHYGKFSMGGFQVPGDLTASMSPNRIHNNQIYGFYHGIVDGLRGTLIQGNHFLDSFQEMVILKGQNQALTHNLIEKAWQDPTAQFEPDTDDFPSPKVAISVEGEGTPPLIDHNIVRDWSYNLGWRGASLNGSVVSASPVSLQLDTAHPGTQQEEYVGYWIEIMSGPGAGQKFRIEHSRITLSGAGMVFIDGTFSPIPFPATYSLYREYERTLPPPVNNTGAPIMPYIAVKAPLGAIVSNNQLEGDIDNVGQGAITDNNTLLLGTGNYVSPWVGPMIKQSGGSAKGNTTHGFRASAEVKASQNTILVWASLSFGSVLRDSEIGYTNNPLPAVWLGTLAHLTGCIVYGDVYGNLYDIGDGKSPIISSLASHNIVFGDMQPYSTGCHLDHNEITGTAIAPVVGTPDTEYDRSMTVGSGTVTQTTIPINYSPDRDDFYNGWTVEWTSGTGGEIREILGYNSSLNEITVSSPGFSTAPILGDNLVLRHSIGGRSLRLQFSHKQADGYYVGWTLYFGSGPAAGFKSEVLTYSGASNVITFRNPFEFKGSPPTYTDNYSLFKQGGHLLLLRPGSSELTKNTVTGNNVLRSIWVEGQFATITANRAGWFIWTDSDDSSVQGNIVTGATGQETLVASDIRSGGLVLHKAEETGTGKTALMGNRLSARLMVGPGNCTIIGNILGDDLDQWDVTLGDAGNLWDPRPSGDGRGGVPVSQVEPAGSVTMGNNVQGTVFGQAPTGTFSITQHNEPQV